LAAVKAPEIEEFARVFSTDDPAMFPDDAEL